MNLANCLASWQSGLSCIPMQRSPLPKSLTILVFLSICSVTLAGIPSGKSLEELATVFSKYAQGDGFDLSPAGDKFIASMPKDGERGLMVFDVSDPDVGLGEGTYIKPSSKYEVGFSTWIDNDYIAYGVTMHDTFSRGFQIAKAEPGKRNPKRYAHVSRDRQFYTSFAGALPKQPMQFLVSINEINHHKLERRFNSFAVMEVNKNYNAKEIKRWRNPDLFASWHFRDGEPYAVTLWEDELIEGKEDRPVYTMDFELLARPDKQSQEKVMSMLEPLNFQGELKACYPNIGVISVMDEERDKEGLQLYDLDEKKTVGKPIFAEGYSLVFGQTAWGIQLKPGGDLIGLSYLTEKSNKIYFDPGIRSVIEQLEEMNPGMSVSYQGISEDSRFFFYSLYTDTLSASFYRLDLTTGNSMLLYAARPDLIGMDLPPMNPVKFKNREGGDIHGYLILPKNYKEGNPVPLVALSHGGPWVRDSWGFDPEAQFYASLGFAVLQVNYRGSKGYGIAYEFDEDMLDICEASPYDVIDGVNWAIDQGYADKDKIALVGASYGAYLSVFCAALAPDLPACAIGFAGVYDLQKTMEADEQERMPWVERLFKKFEDEKERVLNLSPCNHADKVKASILLIHGGKDARVGYRQVDAMSSALKKHGKDVEVVKKRFLLHGFPDEKSARDHYILVGNYLMKHLGN